MKRNVPEVPEGTGNTHNMVLPLKCIPRVQKKYVLNIIIKYNNECFRGMQRNVPVALEGTANTHDTVFYHFCKRHSKCPEKYVLNK